MNIPILMMGYEAAPKTVVVLEIVRGEKFLKNIMCLLLDMIGSRHTRGRVYICMSLTRKSHACQTSGSNVLKTWSWVNIKCFHYLSLYRFGWFSSFA